MQNNAIPREYDAILSGTRSWLRNDRAVLGGVSGVKTRLNSKSLEVRIGGYLESFKYGDTGLDLCSKYFREESRSNKIWIRCAIRDKELSDINQFGESIYALGNKYRK